MPNAIPLLIKEYTIYGFLGWITAIIILITSIKYFPVFSPKSLGHCFNPFGVNSGWIRSTEKDRHDLILEG